MTGANDESRNIDGSIDGNNTGSKNLNGEDSRNEDLSSENFVSDDYLSEVPTGSDSKGTSANLQTGTEQQTGTGSQTETESAAGSEAEAQTQTEMQCPGDSYVPGNYDSGSYDSDSSDDYENEDYEDKDADSDGPDPGSLNASSDSNGGADSNEKRAREHFSTAFDLVDEIISEIQEAPKVFFTPEMAKINRDELIEKLNELKKTMPIQLEHASALMREAERHLTNARKQGKVILSEARAKAVSIRREAEEQAEYLAGQENVVSIARDKARDIMDQANDTASNRIGGADRYAQAVMEDLSSELTKTLQDIDNSIRYLQQRRNSQAEQFGDNEDTDGIGSYDDSEE